MTISDPGKWLEVEAAWRALPVRPTEPAGASLSTRHSTALLGLELTVAVLLVGLGVVAVLEHPGTETCMVAALLGLHAALVLTASVWNRAVIARLLVSPTRSFLAGWLLASRRQLVALRLLVVVLVGEAIVLGNWVMGRKPLAGHVLIPEEVWWVVAIALLLLTAAWTATVRTRTLARIGRITAAQVELNDD
jgi:hypothetical protein